ncbi:MAG: diguanylate cyclase, partial [Burkholderiales bacterium]|nr:diguanylate cyclase [Burkholderiales bacterium]
MSLLRQLLLSVTLAILVILAGATLFSIGSARQYLDAQLQGQSDSTATSLALTLSQPSNQDPTVRELLISVLFDSGQFRVVEFLDPTGRILIRREIEDGHDDRVTAPNWFSHLLPLERHEAQRQVTNGWSQLGVVRLQANDAYARNALWASTVRIVTLTVGAGILWGLFVVMLMRWLRRALQDDVTARVQAMARASA